MFYFVHVAIDYNYYYYYVGYKGEGNETVQCSADGFWSESGFRCLIITCRSPDTLADAHTQGETDHLP